MKWFKHDSDASIDAKLQELLLDYGAAGYGLYWYCIELIAQGVGENNITFELEHDARIIARNLNLTIQETKDMMKKMIDLNLFSVSENNKLACYALAKRLDQSMTSNQGMRNLIANLKAQGHDKVMTESAVSHDKVKTDKNRREETREETREEKKAFSFALKNLTRFDSLSAEYRQELEKYIETCQGITYEDFKTSCIIKNYKYANFKMAYNKWNKNQPTKANEQGLSTSNFIHFEGKGC